MICIPIIAKNTGEALEKIHRANSLADILEFRMDGMESHQLEEMVALALRPVIATYRSEKEGGSGSADPKTIVRHLLKAIETGVDFVDLEYSLPTESKNELIEKKKATRIILSAHLVDGTPPRADLEKLLLRMVSSKVDVVKIVTKAHTSEDNLRVLRLIPMAQRLDMAIISFCMGPMGRISRIASPIMGGYLTFASLERGEESADGQIPVKEMRKTLAIVSMESNLDLAEDGVT